MTRPDFLTHDHPGRAEVIRRHRDAQAIAKKFGDSRIDSVAFRAAHNAEYEAWCIVLELLGEEP